MKRALVFLTCLLVTPWQFHGVMAALAVFGGTAGFIAAALFAAPTPWHEFAWQIRHGAIAFLLPLYGVLALQRAGKRRHPNDRQRTQV